jgi:hypothetical protein
MSTSGCAFVHEPGRRVDGMGIDFVGKGMSTRVDRPQDHMRAAPGLTVADLWWIGEQENAERECPTAAP